MPRKPSRAGRPRPQARGAAPRKAAARPRAAAPADDPVQVGRAAPDVALWDQDGKEFRLRDLRGQRVVLYFYPRDMTSGCTSEACDFQAMLPRFEGVHAAIVGVSPDTAESHRKFRAKHGLEFALAFDPSRKALEAFGVWKEKSLYGRKFMGVERSTFLLDEEGVVRAAWRRVNPDGHAALVLEAVRGLARVG